MANGIPRLSNNDDDNIMASDKKSEESHEPVWYFIYMYKQRNTGHETPYQPEQK